MSPFCVCGKGNCQVFGHQRPKILAPLSMFGDMVLDGNHRLSVLHREARLNTCRAWCLARMWDAHAQHLDRNERISIFWTLVGIRAM